MMLSTNSSILILKPLSAFSPDFILLCPAFTANLVKQRQAETDVRCWFAAIRELLNNACPLLLFIVYIIFYEIHINIS